MRRTILAALALGVIVPLTAQAQEAEETEPPRGLFISSWMCPQSAIDDIFQWYDSLMVPIEQELVNEGMYVGSGMYRHDWGDEWNVNWYRLGQDRAAVFAALPEVGRRFNERHPDAPPGPLSACTAHKDNIYFFGPRTTEPPTSQ